MKFNTYKITGTITLDIEGFLLGADEEEARASAVDLIERALEDAYETGRIREISSEAKNAADIEISDIDLTSEEM